MNNEWKNLTDWFRSNRLSLNVAKTNYMLFTNTKSTGNKTQLKLSNTIITQCRHVKFLGVFIDDKLKWNEHITTITQRISRGFYAINKVKQILPKKHLISLYYTLVFPHLTYGITLWGAAHDTHINKLIITQKKLIRAMTGSPYNAHTEGLFKVTKILKLTDIYKLQISKYVLAALRHTLPPTYDNLFTPSNETHNHQTRHSTSFKLKVIKVRTIVAAQSILNMGPEIWNVLPASLYQNSNETLVSMSCFSSRFKRDALRGYGDK